jgi:ABC-type transport system substrate-binding protein
MHIFPTVRMTSVILLTVAAALSGCTGAPGAITLSPPPTAPSPTVAQPAASTQTTESSQPTTSPAASQTVAAAPTTPAEGAPSGCADLQVPALADVPSYHPGRFAEPIVSPGGGWIAFTAWPFDRPEDLLVISADSTP